MLEILITIMLSLTIPTEPIVVVDNKELDIYYTHSNEEGHFFLEPEAEFENVVFVDYESLIGWGINTDQLDSGDKLTGIFDKDGWDLYSVIQ